VLQTNTNIGPMLIYELVRLGGLIWIAFNY